jgi:TolB-like protein
MKKFIEELKRRNVIKASLAYLVISWIIVQVAQAVLPTFGAPDWVLKALIIGLAIGLPIWIIISWIYEITPAVIVLTLNLSLFSSNPDKEFSIAVIPFDNIRVDEDKDWLSQNFTQSINSYISKVKKLKVIDSYSTSQYLNTVKTNAEIGKELKVSYLLRGNVTQIKNKLSITVELVDVVSNTVDWSESYNEIIEEDPLKLQQEVSQKIVAQLKVALTPIDKKALEKSLTINQEASIYFTEGVNVANKRTSKNKDSVLSISANLFQKAIDLDSTYADAYAEMAFILRMLADENEIFKNTPNMARTYTTLGAIEAFHKKNWKKAKEYYDRALAIKPNDASTNHYYALYLIVKEKPDYEKAFEHINIAYKLNPFSNPIIVTVVIELLRAEKVFEAEEFYKKNSHILSEDAKVILERRIFDAKVKKEIFEKKDWTEAINLYHREIVIDSTNSYLFRILAEAYNEILNDDINYLKYAKKAYELGELYSENVSTYFSSDNATTYYMSLLKSKKFKEAYNLLQDDYFSSLFLEQSKLYLNIYYHYYKRNYSKAQISIDNHIYNDDFELSKNYAQQNKVIKVDSILNIGALNAYEKAIVFAILKERDSMYYYIDNEKHTDNILKFNGSIEVNPYRKEDRYKAFLRKNYLPITHWNE